MTETTTATDTTALIDTYFQMWQETEDARRIDLVERSFTADGRHVDPLADVSGTAALDQMVAGVQAAYPGHALRRTSGIDAHHDQLRYTWELVAPDGTLVVAAVDIARLAEDGRLAQVVAFFGDPPADSTST